MNQEPIEFTIRRQDWQRGALNSKLYDSAAGRSCCLGLYLQHRGVQRESMDGVSTPLDLYDMHSVPFPSEDDWLLGDYEGNDNSANKLMEVNDSPYMDELYRERRVAEIFAQRGITVHITGEG